MDQPLQKFWRYLNEPIDPAVRVVVAALVIPLAVSFALPLWNIHMLAPQYPQGLDLDIYSYKVEGGNEGRDINEINTLNHYIGMAPINREQLSDLGWLPFAIGILALLALRTAALADVRGMIDLCVLGLYVSLFAFGRFVYRLYVLGHNLDPRAPMDVEPFTPAIFGTKQVANFTISSYPQGASILIACFVAGITLATAYQLWVGRRRASRGTP